MKSTITLLLATIFVAASAKERRHEPRRRHRVLESGGRENNYPTYSPTEGTDVPTAYPTYSPTKSDSDEVLTLAPTVDDDDYTTTTATEAAATTPEATAATTTDMATTVAATTAAATMATTTAQATTTDQAAAVPPSCPPTLDASVRIDSKATLHYALVPSDPPGSNNGLLCGRLEAQNDDGWIALGISPNGGGMVGSEAIVGIPAGGTVVKYNLNGKNTASVVPMSPEEQTLIDTSIAVRDEDGMTIMSFTKLLVEDGEIPILESGTNTFLHARGASGAELGYHYNGRMSFEVDFSQGGQQVAAAAMSESSIATKPPLNPATVGDAPAVAQGTNGEGGVDFQFSATGAKAAIDGAASNGSAAVVGAVASFLSMSIPMIVLVLPSIGL